MSTVGALSAASVLKISKNLERTQLENKWMQDKKKWDASIKATPLVLKMESDCLSVPPRMEDLMTSGALTFYVLWSQWLLFW